MADNDSLSFVTAAVKNHMNISNDLSGPFFFL